MASYTLSFTGSQIDALLGAVSTAVSGNGIVSTSGLNTTLGSYLTSTSAASTYLSKTDASSTYLTKTDASSTYLSKTDASSTYLTQSSASSTYFAKSNLSNSLTSTSTTTAATSKAIKDTNDKIAYSTASLTCTTSMTVNACTCAYYNFTLFQVFVISVKATSTCGRNRRQ